MYGDMLPYRTIPVVLLCTYSILCLSLGGGIDKITQEINDTKGWDGTGKTEESKKGFSFLCSHAFGNMSEILFFLPYMSWI